jgi:hypothetical protein
MRARRNRLFSALSGLFLAVLVLGPCPASAQSTGGTEAIDYLVLATNRTSTMQNELNQAADAGYRFAGVMGGETAISGSEVVVIMSKTAGAKARFEYRLLATSRTSTMQKEMQAAGDAGFEYRGQTIFNSAFGGQETVVILERDGLAQEPARFEYRLLATTKTSTMQEELREAGEAGFEFVGVTVASTSFGGSEVVTILRRAAQSR